MSSDRRGLQGLRTSLELVTTVVLLAAAGAVLLDRTGGITTARAGNPTPAEELPLPTGPVSLDGAAMKGDPAAPVAIIEFAEFECPYCLRFAQDTLPTLTAKYIETGRALFAFRHFPLEGIHRQALGAAVAAECARQQGRFWEMHDSIFRRPAQLSETTLAGRATELGLDMALFEQCVDGTALARVRQDQDLGRTLSVRGTPAFLLGTINDAGDVDVLARLSGARPVSDFEAAIDAILAEVSAASR